MNKDQVLFYLNRFRDEKKKVDHVAEAEAGTSYSYRIKKIKEAEKVSSEQQALEVAIQCVQLTRDNNYVFRQYVEPEAEITTGLCDVLDRSVDDFINMIDSVSDDSLSDLYKMLTQFNPNHDSERIKLNELGSKLIEEELERRSRHEFGG